MRRKQLILLFYISAATISVLLLIRWLGLRVSSEILAPFIIVHFISQVLNLYVNEVLTKLKSLILIITIVLAVVLFSIYARGIIFSLLRFYVFFLIFIRNYLYNTAEYPKGKGTLNTFVLLVLVAGIVLKIMHYPGADIALIIGYIGLSVSLVLIGFYKANTVLSPPDEIDEIGKG